ncbi:MAG: TonB-dependent receptor, partial [Acidobacteria bacterium]
MKRQQIFGAALVGACLVLACVSAWGQATTGTILGNVKDQTGAAIPGVGVVATNIDTNFSRDTISDSTGHFFIQYLPVGTYRLEAELVGFKKFVQAGIVVGIDRNARIDPVLQVGEVNETVEVTSDAPLVDTAKTVLGQTVGNAEILNLPLVNRNVYDLLSITAGVQNTASSNAFGPPGFEVSVYGSPNAGTGGVNYTLDGGTSIMSLRNTGNPAPNPDAVQELRITTHMFDAEYGRYGGGVVNVLTKAGTNSFHGSLFHYHRNDALNAQEWNSLEKPVQRRNQFGGSVGGPIKKDKLFFFLSYSGLREREVAFENDARVPTALERTGDFSQMTKALIDPLTKKQFPDNKIPANRLDPTAQNIIKDWVPLPNLPGNYYEAQVPIRPRNDDLTGRIDYSFSDTHQLFGSYFLNKGERADVLGGTLPWTERLLTWKQQNYNVNETWTVSPVSMNLLHLTYVRHIGGRLNTPAKSLADFGSKYQIQGEP